MLHQKDAFSVVLVSFLYIRTYFTPCSSVSIINLEQVNDDWVESQQKHSQQNTSWTQK